MRAANRRRPVPGTCRFRVEESAGQVLLRIEGPMGARSYRLPAADASRLADRIAEVNRLLDEDFGVGKGVAS